MDKPHYWIEFRAGRVVVFLAALGVLVAAWIILPVETKKLICRLLPRRYGRAFLMVPVLWVVGWFMLLFVRGEDLNVVAPINVQGFIKIVAGGLIALGTFIGVFHYLSLI